MSDAISLWMLRIFVVVVFISISSHAWEMGWFIVGVSACVVLGWWLYEAERYPRFIMDVLDRLTNRQRLEEQLRKLEESMESFDAEALARHLKSSVIGQNEVADEVARHLRRRYAARREDKPLAVFCFAGPPGVGKTYFAKELATFLFGDAKNMFFLDMSQYNHSHAASTLFGMTKGYVGSDTYGVLSRHLQNAPHSLVLLDEFEKAHSEVRRRFLTAWNDGFITEASDGTHVATHRAIFVLTTNAASKTIGQLTKRFAQDPDELERACRGALVEEGGLEPEVVSRMDRIFSFAPLVGLDVARVVALEIEKSVVQFSLSLAPGGIDPQVLIHSIERHRRRHGEGVRELARAVEAEITDSLIDARQAGATMVSIQMAGDRVVACVEERTPSDKNKVD